MRLQKNLALLGFGTSAIFGLTGCGSSLADSCEDFHAFDQEYVAEIDRAMSTATRPEASEDDKAAAQELVQEARLDFEEIVADAQDEEFLASADEIPPTYALYEQFIEPDMTQDDQMEILQSGDMQDGLEAQAELTKLCDAEIN
ncbi:hypothetical protein [Yaniella halotolerans]|uniref:hypothetical protein n=1 Tax=Yaniella halotolerans TaxID=225453 RepID=UPI0003B3DBC5|nr:hypothetical protein [Yaniella halotolerans]